MALNYEAKQAIIAELSHVAQTSVSVVSADYRGLSAEQMTQLRAKARDGGVVMRVYRNTLARRAVEDTQFACLKETLVGPLVLMFSVEEPGAAARVLRDFVKVHKALEVKALALGGQLLSADQLEAVASLPSRDEALAKLAATAKAPVSQMVRTVKEPIAQLVRVMAAVRDQKQAA